MTVHELIELLQKCDPNARVETPDGLDLYVNDEIPTVVILSDNPADDPFRNLHAYPDEWE